MILKTITREVYTEKAEASIGVFGSAKWLSAYEESLDFIGIFKDEHQMIGGFYLMKTTKFGFAFIKLPPYTPHCGLFFTSESKNQSSVNSFSKEVISEVCTYISQQKAALTVLAFPSSVVDMQPFIWEKYKVIPNYTYRIDLQKSMEEIKGNFDSKNRNVINKAIKEEVVVSKNTLNKQNLYDFFVNSLSTTGANIYTKELKNVFLKFSDNSNSFSLEAKKNNELLGVVFCVFDKTSCYYLLGGVNKTAGVGGINNILVQRAIETAKELNCRIFDFEGSMLKGVEKFFRGFGPELFPYYTVNKGNMPLEILLKFKKRELF
ncbi:hypothetical protein CNR22_19420 [Sphingobacteriaceae bacterium]|nr:hypothetical protein CNR22_19420 [Sphingobacteriaceae bacterium]